MGKIKLGLIGYGYWGPNFARIIRESEDCELKYCADLNESSLKKIKIKYPQVQVSTNYQEILQDKEIDAVLVVTPTKSHYKIAKDVLLSGKHVFVEKPLTINVKESEKLVTISQNKKKVLMVGHVFLYNSSVRYIKKAIDSNILGKIRHLHFQRRSLGPIRQDVNVLWDLAPHDISMLLYFIKEKPESVIAIGESFLQQGIYDVVSASITFEDKIIANMIFSWIDPIKIRDITIVGDRKMLFFDDVRISEKLKLYDKNVGIIERTKDVTFGEYQVSLHSGGIFIPAINNNEPLKDEFNDFIQAIISRKKHLNDGKKAVAVVKILDALQRSLDNNSKKIYL